MAIISMSLAQELLNKLDELVQSSGYSSRSEVIREAIRDYVVEHAMRRGEMGEVMATITAISKHESHDVDERLTRLRHHFDDIITGNFHIHLGTSYCLEILIAQGDSKQVLNFIDRIRTMRGIQQVKYSLVPME